MHIFLTGYMGVGKTTIGGEISEVLHLPFIDLDKSIEKQSEKTIAELFQTEGQEGFRQIEQKALLSAIAQKEQHVISLGGGTIAHLQNHEIILQNGVCIYLYKPWKEIEKDIKSLPNRPLTSSLSINELEALFIKREPFYELSQLKVPINKEFDSQKLAQKLRLSTNR